MACHKSYFNRLSTELVILIFELLNDASPKSLLSIALACRRFHTHSNPIIHRCLVIPISPRAYRTVGELVKHLSRDSALCAAVREMVIPRGPKTLSTAFVEPQLERLKQVNDQWDRLTNVLPLLKRLNKFTYEAEALMPWALLHHLNNRYSDCRLHVNVTHLTRDKNVSRLRDSPALFALEVNVSMWNTLKEVCEVVSTCHNLRHLSMYTSDYPIDEAEMKVLRTAVESPRTLDSLGLQGFHDTITAFRTHGVKQLKHAGEDRSSLTRLSFSGLSLIPGLALEMVNLRSLQVDLGATNDPEIMRDPILNQFLYECRPLCELKLISYTETFDLGVLEHHGRALRVFTLREDHRNLLVYSGREIDRWYNGPSVVLSDKDIQRIGESCPYLLTLGIDLCQQENGDARSWPYGTLIAVVEHLWFIKHLDLYVEVGQNTPYRLAVTFASVQHVWEFMARLSERDDEASRGIVTVTNDKVESLKWLMRQEEGSRSLEKKFKEAQWIASVGAYEYVRVWDAGELPYR